MNTKVGLIGIRLIEHEHIMMRTKLYNILFIALFVGFFNCFTSSELHAHGGGLNSKGCHNNTKTGDYHCHRSGENRESKKSTHLDLSEASFNRLLAKKIGGKTEITLKYNYGLKSQPNNSGTVRVDIMTKEYVIEGGKDTRSSLDSIQQAVFASVLTNKKPAVAIYDTDGIWGKYEHRVYTTAKKLDVKFIWFSNGQIRIDE